MPAENATYKEFMEIGIELPYDSQVGSVGAFIAALLEWTEKRAFEGNDELGVFNALFWKVVSGTKDATAVKDDFIATIRQLSSLTQGLQFVRSFNAGAYAEDTKILQKISKLIDAFSDSANDYNNQFMEQRKQFEWKDDAQRTSDEVFYHNTGKVVEIIASGLNVMKLTTQSIERAFELQYKPNEQLGK